MHSRNVGRIQIADNIIQTMKSAVYDIRETDPFSSKLQFTITNRDVSPYGNRIIMMWQQNRDSIIKLFPKSQEFQKIKRLICRVWKISIKLMRTIRYQLKVIKFLLT
ncbi:MAG: hypothetical protein IPN18_10570 [Ignavibacteriales bacterium]|nr:hypothetical protein [Ignavibacteriales bacterium]